MAAQILFRTQGVASSFVNTTNSIPIFLTAGAATRFLNTFQATPFFQTGGVSSSFLTTNANFPAFLTPSQAVTFLTTVDANTAKLLKLKIGTLDISTGYTFVNVPDATGDYNALTNPGGYNILPLPYNAARPYRDNVALWTVYRIWNVYGSDTQSPDNQDPQYDDPYTYQLFFPTQANAEGAQEVIKGVYEIILIAAPYFNETDTNGTYDSDSAETYYILKGTDTDFADVLVPGDYLYYLNETNGDLVLVEEVLKDFSNTTVALVAAPATPPTEGARLYGSNSQITTTINSGGVVAEYTSGEYTPVAGTGTAFNTFTAGDTLFYVDSATGDYKPMGEILQIISPLNINLVNVTENVATSGDVLVAYASDEVPVINSQGTFDSNIGNTITGADTLFLLEFTAGQTLYSQTASTGELNAVGVISSIFSDTELTLSSVPIISPNPGDRLFASDNPSLALDLSNGTFASYAPVATYYTLTGDGTAFNTFSNADYVYIVSNRNYNELGQVSFVQSATSMVFYSPAAIDVLPGSFIVASSVQLSLEDVSGEVLEYETGSYYNLVGDGTTFLTTAEPQQYLFYEDNSSGLFIKMGQIFQVFDNTNLWLYGAPEGFADNTTTLYTSYSLNTETAFYVDYKGLDNLYDIANQSPGWFVTSAGLLVDDALVNCLSRMRYEFLQSVMCGKCDESYLHTYSLYVGMLNAMEVGEWLLAVDFYNKLKVICAEQDDSSCGC